MLSLNRLERLLGYPKPIRRTSGCYRAPYGGEI